MVNGRVPGSPLRPLASSHHSLQPAVPIHGRHPAEVLWNETALEKVRSRFSSLVADYAGADLNDYNLRRIGSELEGEIRTLLQAGVIRYNPDSRVLNYSLGLPRTSENL